MISCTSYRVELALSKSGKPFHEVEYQKEEDGSFCPILKILVGKDKKEISAYADTGCTSGLSVFKEQIEDIDIGTKISDDNNPTPCIMADGHVIGADEYLATVSIEGEEKEVNISVIDPNKDMGYVSFKAMTPLLGRDFLDKFDVLYKGEEKKIALFKC